MKKQTYVMPEPKATVENGEFRFTGQAVPVDVSVSGNVLDYLKAAGVYDSNTKVYNGAVGFDNDFSISERLKEVDDVLAAIDGNKLKKDLDEKGYAFLMAKGKASEDFRDYQKKGFIANTDRVIQDLVYQKIPKEFKLDFDVRHFKLQEAVELVMSDEAYKVVMNDYWQHNLEVIQKLVARPVSGYKLTDGKLEIVKVDSEVLTPTEVSSVWSGWGADEGCFLAAAFRPSGRVSFGLASLKKVEPRKAV